jgi:hypothetical protein
MNTLNKMIVTYGPAVVRKLLMLQGLWFVQHGVFSSSYVEVYVSVGTAAVGAAWSFWNDYGRDIVLSQLEVLKAKSLAQAAKLRDAGLPQVTVSQIAEQSPTLTPSNVVKIIAKLPPAVQANVANAA